MSFRSKQPSILDKTLSRGKTEVNMATFALLFSEMVRYSQNRVNTVAELQAKLAELGSFVGARLLDVIVHRERGYKRETKLLPMLMFVKSTIWRSFFGREADKLERSNDDPCTCSLNCASFVAGILESVLNGSNFPCKVTAHWHSGTTYMIQFDEAVIARERLNEGTR